jgi:hypothetical protein
LRLEAGKPAAAFPALVKQLSSSDKTWRLRRVLSSTNSRAALTNTSKSGKSS